jgi:hypothetical protein
MVRLRMSSPARNEMDVDAFLAWAEGREGRWRLHDGQPLMISPERASHALTKYAAQKAFEAGILRATAVSDVSWTVPARRADRL